MTVDTGVSTLQVVNTGSTAIEAYTLAAVGTPSSDLDRRHGTQLFAVETVTGASDVCVGVATQRIEAGGSGTVVYSGLTTVATDGTITAGALLKSTAAGLADVATDGTDAAVIFGRAATADYEDIADAEDFVVDGGTAEGKVVCKALVDFGVVSNIEDE